MDKFNYKNFEIISEATEDSLPNRDAIAKNFGINDGKKSFRIRLRISGIDLAKNDIGREECDDLFKRGVEIILEKYYSNKNTSSRYFDYYIRDWFESNEKF